MPSVQDLAQRLRIDYPNTLLAVADGGFAFWIGSGISGKVVPRLPDLMRRLLIFLRDHVDSWERGDPHFDALHTIASTFMSPEDIAAIESEHASWIPPADLGSLVSNYSAVLNTPVAGHNTRYLVVDGLDIAETFGSPHLEPAAEHLALGILVIEGVVSDIVTANWDGLIEKALAKLAPPEGPMEVRLSNDSFRNRQAAPSLLKIHGCAIKMRNDPDAARFIVARAADIANWMSESSVSLMRQKAISLATTSRTLVAGLSARDANILAVFAEARNQLDWDWDPSSLACLVAEPQVTVDQNTLLETIYGDQFSEAREEIVQATALGAFADLVFSALIFEIVRTKLVRLIAENDPVTPMVPMLAQLFDAMLADVGEDSGRAIELIVRWWAPLVAVFRGEVLEEGAYRPLTSLRGDEIAGQEASALQDERAFARTLVALSTVLDDLTARASDVGETPRIILQDSENRTRDVFLTSGHPTSVDLIERSTEWEAGAATSVLIHTRGSSVSYPTRSPNRAPTAGRQPGRPSVEVWLEDWLSSQVADQIAARVRMDLAL